MSSKPNAKASKSDRLSPVDWVLTAIDAVREDGADGMRIDRLCRDLGVTKGSFYHHFESRKDLVGAIAEYWARTQPNMVHEHLSALPRDPRARLVAMTKFFADRDLGTRDHAMRAWGATEPQIRDAVATADASVLALLDSLMAEMGLDEDARHDYARLMMFSAVGFNAAPHLVERGSRKRITDRLLALVAASAAECGPSR